MGKYVRVVKGAGVKAAVIQLKREHQLERAKHRHAERYIADHVKTVAADVFNCRTRPRIAKDVTHPDRYSVRLYGCHKEPWCFACVREARGKRAMQALERFARCKPANQQPRYAHIVSMAQLRDDGLGWGHMAARRVKDFNQIMWRTVKDAYGEGAGAFFSYQAFGERAFGKLAPHIDFTVNGWRLGDDGAAEKTPIYDLTCHCCPRKADEPRRSRCPNSGHAQWMKRHREHVAARFLVDPIDVNSDLHIQSFVVGSKAYIRAIKYQVREMVDVRKMTYDRERQLVYWSNYKENTRERMTVEEFKQGLADYQSAVGAWGHNQAKTLHRPFGHMADRVIGQTQKAMGGEIPDHRQNCHCGECNDWELFDFDEDDDGFDPWTGE